MVASLFVLVGCGNTDELEEQIADLESTNSNLEGEIATLEGEVASLQAVVEELTAEIEELAVPEIAAFNEAELIGVWGNRSGDFLASPFSGRSSFPGAEFSEDNTFTRISSANERSDMVWQVSDTNHLVIDGNNFGVEINGDILTITDEDGNQAVFQRLEEDDEDEDDEDEDDEDEDDEDDEDDDEDDSSNGTSTGADVDWRQFLRDYDAFQTRFLRDPLGLLEESFEWIEQSAEILESLEGTDYWLEFFEESLRIGTRTE